MPKNTRCTSEESSGCPSACLCSLCVCCVVLDAPAGHRTARFLFVVRSLSLPSFCILAFRLMVFLWRFMLVHQLNILSYQQTSILSSGRRPERMLGSFFFFRTFFSSSFFFLFFLSFLLFCFVSLFVLLLLLLLGCTYSYKTVVPWICSWYYFGCK